MKAKKKSASSSMDDVEALAKLLKKHELSEIELERSGVRIRLRRDLGGAGHMVEGMQAMTLPASAAPPAPTATEVTDGNISYITSPFVGTFYRASGPDTAPFVDVGTRVKKGQILCIVEAMKLMNEIESEVDGVIVQILAQNGHAVEYGEPLYKVKQE